MPERRTEVAQQHRPAKHFAKSIAPGEREVDRRRCAIEQEPEEQPLLVAAVTDLAQADLAAVGVGEDGILDAALREEVVLHADGEEVGERAAAEVHDVAGPDGSLLVVGRS